MSRSVKAWDLQQVSGVFIIAAIALGMIAANSPLSSMYWTIHHTPIQVQFGPYGIEEPLISWINDGLMVFFFLLVGLEIKREILEGRLSTPAKVALPIFSAVGGMLFPALIYASLTWNDAIAINGWAISTATDIVLALGILSLLGAKVPISLKVFLTAVAIFDDIGAVLIIGLFYSDELSSIPLLISLIATGTLLLTNSYRIDRVWVYIVVGSLLWIAMLKAGVEAALAGVIIAFAVPMRVAKQDNSPSPVRILEERLEVWVPFAIVPLFAFFNAGVKIEPGLLASLTEPISLGIILGLVVGKPIGIFGSAIVAVQLGFGRLPSGVNWGQMFGVAMLAGIGFTMSLFVASLAFSDVSVMASAKIAVLSASFFAAISGLTVLYVALPGPARAS
ncbi:MAG: sodium:proton antiporter [Alphaproteobacteria bacterium BRH_c36]|nr:MAG: sodium:proton antiporter [Alphaproteobacteria bacterium BRH_c36]